MIVDPAEAAAAEARRAAARRVHIPGHCDADRAAGVHPRGLHVRCAGDPAAVPPVSGCGAEPWTACSHPTRGDIPGFVHPTRMAAERAWAAEGGGVAYGAHTPPPGDDHGR